MTSVIVRAMAAAVDAGGWLDRCRWGWLHPQPPRRRQHQVQCANRDHVASGDVANSDIAKLRMGEVHQGRRGQLGAQVVLRKGSAHEGCDHVREGAEFNAQHFGEQRHEGGSTLVNRNDLQALVGLDDYHRSVSRLGEAAADGGLHRGA